MSVAAELWKHVVSGADATPPRKPPTRISQWEPQSANPQQLSLVHQLFFPAVAHGRRSVLVVAADEQSNASVLCENLAVTLSKISGQRVAIVDDRPFSAMIQTTGCSSGLARSPWQAYAAEVSGNVWRVASAFVCHERNRPDDANDNNLKGLRSAFEYLLLSATVADRHMPTLCRLCDAAVLLLTANVTRREAALRAKEHLLLHKVNLVGAVLDQRILPIPEVIYHRL